MYYKVVNKDSSVYKRLYEMRDEEIKREKRNLEAIKKKIPLNWEHYYGGQGQQNFGRCREYCGFYFTCPELVDMRVWKPHKDHDGLFVPNRRTAAGREMYDFLRSELERGWYEDVYKALNLQVDLSRFAFPFVEIMSSESILLFLSDSIDINDENVIEITKKEYEEIYKNEKCKLF